MEGTVLVFRQPTHAILGTQEQLVGELEPVSHQENGMDGLQYALKINITKF